ncbi:hypothetical protein [Hasllibacter sp. MH4015]|uniref:hypothetical protein n=1 Tax=Hasllibacter sp. MH4015 TaxID=2854029 RepID=UPI001CD66B34|nr:hypothetical protein [Hasllibacter sp. MH4015]
MHHPKPNQFVLEVMQWARTKDLEDTAPLDQSDLDCMKAIRAVLVEHGKLDRFALHLTHKHFDLADDEVLVEYSNEEKREQYFRVEKADSEIASQSIPTTWTLERMEPSARCVCAWRPAQGHLARHETGEMMQMDDTIVS